MKNLLLVLGLGALVALGPALAQNMQGNVMFEEAGMEGDLRSSELVGADVYTTATAIDQHRFQVDSVPNDWEQIASVSDLVLGMDGQVRGVLVDIGGFLGLGARTVMMSMDSLRIATQADSDAVYVVVNATREQLEAAPEYMAHDRTGQMRDGMAQPAAPATTTDRDATGSPRVGIGQPQEGFATVAWSTLTVDQLRNADVYDINNQRVSSISDVLLGADDSVQAVLIDVGGFLGLGARTVAVPMDQLEIQGNQDGSHLRVYLAITQEQLEATPEHVRN